MYNNLYHFTSIDSLMKILISNEIRLNNIKNVNDIDEFSDLETEIETSTTAIKQKRDLINQKNILEEFIKTQKDFNIQQIKSLHTNVDLDSFSLSKTTKAFKEIKETESIINANEQKIKKIKKDIAKIAQSKNTNRIMNLDVRKFLYLTCFTYLSKEDENPIKQIINKTTMWGHYADKHKPAGSQGETIAVNNPLLLHAAVHVGYFRESKPKFLSPKSFSTMAEITPTTIFFVEKPETSENQTGFAP